MSTYYESDRGLGEYLLFHYGSAAEVFGELAGPVLGLHFPSRCVSECVDVGSLPVAPRALDLGCGVGRSTFELARSCVEVIGVDASTRFVWAGQQLAAFGSLDYTHVLEGDLRVPGVARVPADIDRTRVRFLVGDATRPDPGLGAFDVIFLGNLIDRLEDPKACLGSLRWLAKPGAQVVVASPYSWMEEHTPRAAWLGGFVEAGKELRTIDGLRRVLHPDFEMRGRRDIPFLLREHARKFQWGIAEATMWRRRPTAEPADGTRRE